MQNYKYDKAIVPESKNGGSPALNNNPRKGGSKRVLLICLDLFCLFMGECSPTGHPHLLQAPGPAALSAPEAPQPSSGRRASRELPALPDPQSQACEYKLGRAYAFAAAGTSSLGVISSWERGAWSLGRCGLDLHDLEVACRSPHCIRVWGELGSYGSDAAGPGCM
ncbi:hypothetical protein NN561_013651 [Cricetulus griseus]